MAQKKNVKSSKMSVMSLPNGGKAPGKTSTPTPVTKKMGDKKVKSC
jgi:hypothetical protein